MAIKKYSIDRASYTLFTQPSSSTNTSITITDNETSQLYSFRFISWEPIQKILYFCIGNKHYKAHVLSHYRIPTKKNPLILYLYPNHETIHIFVASENNKETLKADFVDKLESPLTGRITKILVLVGEKISKNTPLLIIESMKMENELRSPCAGFVKTIPLKQNDVVESGQIVMTFAPEEGSGDAATKNKDGKKKVPDR